MARILTILLVSSLIFVACSSESNENNTNGNGDSNKQSQDTSESYSFGMNLEEFMEKYEEISKDIGALEMVKDEYHDMALEEFEAEKKDSFKLVLENGYVIHIQFNDHDDIRSVSSRSIVSSDTDEVFFDDAIDYMEGIMEATSRILAPQLDDQQYDEIIEAMDYEGLINIPESGVAIDNNIVMDDIMFETYIYEEDNRPFFKIFYKGDPKNDRHR